MRLQTEGAVDATGKPIPVFVPDTKSTVKVTLNTATSTSSPTSTTFGATVKTYPSCTLAAGSGKTVTLTSLLGGYDGSHISVTVGDDTTALSITVSGKDITIQCDSDTGSGTGTTCAELVAAINAHAEASKLVVATTNGTTQEVTASQGKQYLTGWDSGSLGTLVCCYNGGSNVCFIGTFPESDLGTPTASMPIAPKGEKWIVVGPGEKIVARGTADEVLYLTPMRKY